MIVTCPNCETRFLLDDSAFGASRGRRIRCASCGNVWRYSSEAAALHAAVQELVAEAEAHAAADTAAVVPASAPPTPAVRPEPGAGEPLAAAPRPSVLPPPAPPAPVEPIPIVELRGATRQRRLRAGGLSLLALALAVLVIVILARDTVLLIWPQTAPVYETFHLSAAAGAGLVLTLATPNRTSDSVVIKGNVVNSNPQPQRVPKLRVTLQDGTKNDLDTVIIDPPVGQLAPNARADFTTVFPHPSITAAGAEVNFATE